MKRYNIHLIFIFCTLVLFACKGEDKWKDEARSGLSFVTVDGTQFRDPYNRQLILHGINLIVKDPDRGYICGISREEFGKVKAWGFNVVRLGIIWDGLEPDPGSYSEEMFRCLDERIKWARESDLYVILDMHQDLYSVNYSDGAPSWATLTDGLPHYTGEVWSDAYLISPAVQKAFDHFWNNSLASDGVGIQDHYANLWQQIAERYANETIIIGFDLMNEPFMGTEAQAYFPAMVEAYMGIFHQEIRKAGMDANQLGEMWNQPEGRAEILNTLKDTAVYAEVIGAVKELNQAFESGPLMEMYSRVGAAIRKVNKHHILFLEHSYFSNPGVPSGIDRIVYEDGTEEDKVAYAPHGYDLVVDTKAYTQASNDRVGYLFDQNYRTSQKLNMPMLVGEWGAFNGMDSSFIYQTRFILEKFEQYKCGHTFWARYPGMENHPYFSELVRPCPREVAGSIDSFQYDPQADLFTCSWMEDGSESRPSTFILPGITPRDSLDIKLVPKSSGFDLEFQNGETNGGILKIKPSGKPLKRKLLITFTN